MAGEVFRVQNPATDMECALHLSNWNAHVAKRIELTGHERNVEATVQSPFIAILTDDGAVHKYALGYGTGKLAGAYLHVVERDNGDGTATVRTAWFTRHLEDGIPLYWRGSKIGGS